MMPPLLHFIFGNLDVSKLNREEVIEHLRYLEEIITPGMPAADQLIFLNYKVQLNKRLVQLDKLNFINFNNLSRSIVKNASYYPIQ